MGDQMRAWAYTIPGRPENVLNITNLQCPRLTSADQVLIKVTHVSILSSSLLVFDLIPNFTGRPRIPELDFAGEIVEAGKNVRSELQELGTLVFGATKPTPLQVLGFSDLRGVLTEYIVAHQKNVVVKPHNITNEEASGAAGVGCTAMQFLDYANVKPGDNVLINGASGAVGIMATQMAKHIVGPQGNVVTTSSKAKVDMVKELGADVVIDYKEHSPLHEYLASTYGERPFDAIIDCVGVQDLYVHSAGYLKKDAPFLNMGIQRPVGRDWAWSDIRIFFTAQLKNYFRPRFLGGTPRKYAFISATPEPTKLERIRQMIADGKLKYIIDSVWPFEEARAAYERFETNATRGRVVIEVQKFQSQVSNTAFKQQRLKSWQPLLTPKTVLPILFAVGIVFAPLGGLFLWASETVNEIEIDYTDCGSVTTNPQLIPSNLWSYHLGSSNTTEINVPQYYSETVTTFLDNSSNPQNLQITRCHIQFTIGVPLKPSVFIYYKLTNFYQNHRQYVKSFSQNQLNGQAVDASTADSSCSPVGHDPVSGKPYYPCGLIANSMFNDTIGQPTLVGGTPSNFVSTNIAWPADQTRYAVSSYTPDNCLPPPNWQSRYPNNSFASQADIDKIARDEHFLVWMRLSWYPTFRKLWSRYDGPDTLAAGTYQIQIDSMYPITTYGGRKSIVISGTSFLGDRNSFMGYAYIAMGCICALLGLIFLARNCFKPRKLGDHTYLNWDQSGGQRSHRQDEPGRALHMD
ncbi:hypothetical protein BZG36_02246 [Bifiguratus adelaidae]|uniref:Enoyl reductase (ER) domain-containing protein n=1 Tax=Bifiguratus adelaidae TaxID=1938954 RepID=A0A261Y1Q4_9FUNG|nr:hypothetical protein BZG36_02246 [Bifiguratus adelaidae]